MSALFVDYRCSANPAKTVNLCDQHFVQRFLELIDGFMLHCADSFNEPLFVCRANLIKGDKAALFLKTIETRQG